MHLIVNKSFNLQGNIILPGSKSQSIRGMLFALLAKGESRFQNVLDADDTQTAMRICSALGANVELKQSRLIVTSNGLPLRPLSLALDTGDSGITTRFILPLLGLREDPTTPILVKCSEQMRARPIQSLIDALRNLGMSIQYVENEGRLPVLVSGRLRGGVTEVDGITSQYLSALLIGLPCAENDSVISVRHLHERPYVDMTLAWLQQQGIDYNQQRTGHVDTFHIRGNQQYMPFHTTINGDFSSASCLIAAAAILPGEVTLEGLDQADPQEDKRLITILQQMGADIVIEKKRMRIKGNKTLMGCCIDANDIPDLLPALAVIATCAIGKTEIVNVPQARMKETDRIHSMTEGLRQMGARIEEYPDGMTVYQSALEGAIVNGYHDHRTVMALTVAGIIARGKTTISDGDAMTKTYPGFVDAMQTIGAKIRIQAPVINNLQRRRLHPGAPANLMWCESPRYACEQNNHIILIGFKSVGKTSIGQALANVLNKQFIDLDREVEKCYIQRYEETITCRQIMQHHGEVFYRSLETDALKKVLKSPPCVISLGGGTPLSQSNQEIITSHCVFHVVAPHDIVFARIMVEGRPAFFNSDTDPYESFSRLWKERYEIYKNLAVFTVDNGTTVEHAVNEALHYLYQQG